MKLAALSAAKKFFSEDKNSAFEAKVGPIYSNLSSVDPYKLDGG